MKIHTDIKPDKILSLRGLGASDGARKFLASEVKRLCDPYVPMAQGTLKNTTRVAADGSAVVYPAPYAHYQYYGEVMVGRAPKQYTGKPIDYHGGPTRGKEWDRRMMADRGDELLDAFAKHVRGHKK